MGTIDERLVHLNVFMLNAALTALGVATVFAERRRLEVERVVKARLEGVLLAARTIEHELRNQLALNLGWAVLVATNPALPGALRSAAAESLHGAQQAAVVLDRLQQLCHVQEADWGPNVPRTIDLERSHGAGG